MLHFAVAALGCTSSLSWIFRTNASLGYCHMSMIEKVGNHSLVAAFQAAKVHEGLNDQSLYVTFSNDRGTSWSDATTLVSGGSYAVWGPVLHYDAQSSKLWLFYAQSGRFDQRSPGRSQVGGDLNAITSQDGGEQSRETAPSQAPAVADRQFVMWSRCRYDNPPPSALSFGISSDRVVPLPQVTHGVARRPYCRSP